MNPILIRSPGAGKGTQAEKIIDTYGIPCTSTGDIFRATTKDETTLGLGVKPYIDKGELVPNGVTNGIVRECLTEPDMDKRLLLSNFPRTLDQAKVLDTMFKGLNKKTDAVIDIHVEEDVLIERLIGRFIYRACGAMHHKLFNLPKVEGTCDRCGGHEFYQREDDKPETAKGRPAANVESSASILAFYKEQDLMHTIDGNREIDAVFSDVKKITDKN